MRTKNNIIEDLIEFAVSIVTDKSIDSDVNSVTIRVYSPEDTGVDGDKWHSLINYHDNIADAMNMHLRSECSNSAAIYREDGESDDKFIRRIGTSVAKLADKL